MTSKQWLIAAILTFATICAWVIFEILHTRAEVEIAPNIQQVLEPVDPNFNTSALDSKP